jgi:hypothetical protein
MSANPVGRFPDRPDSFTIVDTSVLYPLPDPMLYANPFAAKPSGVVSNPESNIETEDGDMGIGIGVEAAGLAYSQTQQS